MRTTLVLAVASAYAFAPAHAQDGSGAGCVLACFTRTSKDGCSPADTRCLCANPVFTAGMFGCMRGTCAGAAYTDAENTVLGACQVLGITSVLTSSLAAPAASAGSVQTVTVTMGASTTAAILPTYITGTGPSSFENSMPLGPSATIPSPSTAASPASTRSGSLTLTTPASPVSTAAGFTPTSNSGAALARLSPGAEMLALAVLALILRA